MSMNVPKAYEIALATVIRECGDIGHGAVFRCWQTLRNDPTWKVTDGADRTRFTVDIRAAPPVTPDNERPSGLSVTALIEARTKVEDDQDHAAISAAYEAVQSVIDKLHDQFYSGNAGMELARFLEIMETECGARFGFGGLTFADGTAPYDDDGYSVIGVGLTAHYSRGN